MRRLITALAFCAAFFCAGTLHARATASPTVFSGTISAACVTFSGCPAGTVVPATLPLVPSIVTVQVAGTFSGTIQFEGSIDCQNGWPVTLSQNGVGSTATSTTFAGLWSGTIFYVSCFQVRASQWTSGSAKISIVATPLTGGTSLSGGSSGGGTQNVICISGCSGLAPLPGTGGTPVTTNQSVGLQGLSSDGTQMLPWQFNSTGGLPVNPVIGATPFPVSTSPPNSITAPLPGNATAIAGSSQNIGQSFFDGSSHMVPVSATSPLPVAVQNTQPLSPHGYTAVEPGVNSNGFPTPPPPATFACTATITLATASADVFGIQASATKTVRIRKLYVGATSGTAATQDLSLVLRSTLDTGGTGNTTITPVPLDSTNASPTANCIQYGTAPTNGTAVGTLYLWKQNYILSTNGSSLDLTSILNGQQFEQFPTLRSNTTYQISLANGASAVTTPSLDVTVIFTEE